MDHDFSALARIAEEAAVDAGTFARREFGRVGARDHQSKGSNDFFTYVDVKAEEIIMERILKLCPGHSIIAEESGSHEGRKGMPTWHIDPVDGTNNYIHRIPFYAVSIGVSLGGQPRAGVIFAPEQNELFRAADGGGAFLNDRRIRISACPGLDHAAVAFGFPHRERAITEANFDRVRPILARAGAVRRFGSAALDFAWLARGRINGYIELNLHQHDIAAGIVIAREAGALVSGVTADEDCFQTCNVVAGSEAVHKEMLAELVRAG